MSLTVEDGSGLSTADAYVSLTTADAYHSAHGNAAWTGTNAAKEAAIVEATAWIDRTYRGRWTGQRRIDTQSLAWPRRYGSDEDGYEIAYSSVPTAVVNATCEAALKIIGGTTLDPDTERGGRIKSESVGSLSVTYMDGAPSGTQFVKIDRILSGLITSKSNPRIMRG